MGKPKICSRPFQCISLDLIGPLPMSRRRNQYILVVTCCFTKYCLLFPLKRALASNIISNLENFVFLVHGVPQTIIMDNGPQFRSREFNNLLTKYKIPFPSYSPHYCPQVNPTERYNRTIITALASLVDDDHRSWDLHLPSIQNAMNNSVNVVTGYTPSFLVYGREIVTCGSLYTPTHNLDEITLLPRDIYAGNIGLLANIFDKVQTSLHIAHTRNAARYDLRHPFKEFNVGEFVWRKNYPLSNAGAYFSAKLAPRYLKCRVVQKISPLVYLLEDPNGSRAKWHVKDFKI
ncbi:integrase core domain-containing protein [Phthorimaea operculella]|nr:integrase core domain-containing protein [Phthorimaea operculella]